VVQKKRKCNVLSLIDLIGAEIIYAESLPFYNEDLYFNMNRTEDYNLQLNKLRLIGNELSCLEKLKIFPFKQPCT
jgi:hypothetical protein